MSGSALLSSSEAKAAYERLLETIPSSSIPGIEATGHTLQSIAEMIARGETLPPEVVSRITAVEERTRDTRSNVASDIDVGGTLVDLGFQIFETSLQVGANVACGVAEGAVAVVCSLLD